MPDLTRFPTWEDVEDLFHSAKFWPDDSRQAQLARGQADNGAQAAAAEWETATGWFPFLNTSGEVETRTFHVDRKRFTSTGVLQLEAGLLSLSSVSVLGSSYASNRVIAKPDNARAKKKPITYLHFPHVRYLSLGCSAYPVEISVSGVWGYCDVCPADAWQQILQSAGLVTLTQVENLQNVAAISQDGFNKQYDVVGVLTQTAIADRWKREYDKHVEKYKRVIV